MGSRHLPESLKASPRVFKGISVGFYCLVSTVRLYSNNRLPILKRLFAYTQTLKPHFLMG